MAITSYQIARYDKQVVVTVASDLAGTVYYHWFVDGAYRGRTLAAVRTFYLDSDEARVEVQDSNDADYDPAANAPEWFPGTRTLWWVRSLAADVAYYRVEQAQGGGDWAVLAIVWHHPGRWSYELETDRLEDLADYQWRVIPVDPRGNDGTAIELAAERVVRAPDCPTPSVTYDAGTDKVTFADA